MSQFVGLPVRGYQPQTQESVELAIDEVRDILKP